MKIALCSSYVPFVQGGARNIVDWLDIKLREYGHEVEVIYLPEVDEPNDLMQQMMAFRWVDLDCADRVICFRPQSHLICHPNKVLWFIHHIRAFYDLWDSPYRGFPDDAWHKAIRSALFSIDTAAIQEAQKVFTNSKIVSERLKKYNQMDSEVLYPPVIEPERFHFKALNDEIVCICRVEHHKRQHLLIEALKHTKTPVKLRLCGQSLNQNYTTSLLKLIDECKVRDRVVWENRWISEEEKVFYFSTCLASAYLPVDEDSYGYPSIESSLSSKAVLTLNDAGGVLELVEHGVNGYIAEPHPADIAYFFDCLYRERANTKALGENAYQKLKALGISWDRVVSRLLA